MIQVLTTDAFQLKFYFTKLFDNGYFGIGKLKMAKLIRRTKSFKILLNFESWLLTKKNKIKCYIKSFKKISFYLQMYAIEKNIVMKSLSRLY